MIEKYFRGISDEGMPLFFVCCVFFRWPVLGEGRSWERVAL